MVFTMLFYWQEVILDNHYRDQIDEKWEGLARPEQGKYTMYIFPSSYKEVNFWKGRRQDPGSIMKSTIVQPDQCMPEQEYCRIEDPSVVSCCAVTNKIIYSLQYIFI